jgi:multidrug resistance protein MdtO
MAGSRFWNLVRREMAPYPGRASLASRFVVASAVVVTASMMLEVPLLAIGLIATFFSMQENLPLTRRLTLLGNLGLTLAISFSILLLRFTIDLPLLRILGACALAFCGVYLLQVSKPLKLAGFLTAMAAVYTQSLPDTLPNGEALTRLLLWVLIAGYYPTIVSLGVTWLFPASRPVRQFKAEVAKALEDVGRQIQARRSGESLALDLDAVEEGITRRGQRLDHAIQDDPGYLRDRGRHLIRKTAVERLHSAATRLSRKAPSAPAPREAALLQALARACEALKAGMDRDRPFRLDPEWAQDLAPAGPMDADLADMADAFRTLAEAEAAPAPLLPPPPRTPLFDPGAFRTSTHAKVALRTVLAAMVCYVIQVLVDWPGIHTAMLTCIILAMPPLGVASLGGISHKGLVRVLGAGLGSGIALFQTVYILPHLDGITGLLAMVLPVVALCGWIASGSSKSHYVGRQMMFTYALALLGHFALVPDIPEIRDRSVGILVGVAVYLFISTLVWPGREHESLRASLARAVRSLARMARAGQAPPCPETGFRAIDRSRSECWTRLREARDLEVRVNLEPGDDGRYDIRPRNLHEGFTGMREVLFALDGFQIQVRQKEAQVPPALEQKLARFREKVARDLERIAELLEQMPPTGEGLAPASTESLEPESKVCLEPAGAWADLEIHEWILASRALQGRIVQLGVLLSPGTSRSPEAS